MKVIYIGVFFSLVLLLSCSKPTVKESNEPTSGLPLTWENIFTKNYGAGRAILSPNGDYVAVTGRTENERGIFLIDLKNNSEPQFWVAGGSPWWYQ